MRKAPLRVTILVLLLVASAAAAQRRRNVTLGKWTTVQWFVGANEDQTLEMKIRTLYVDGDPREFTTGEPHDVTDRLFVVRRVYRVNDRLPQEERAAPRWRWQRGGWLLVDRRNGNINAMKLPEFDPFYSSASWFRDYVAYCGVSDDGEKLFAVVAQVGQKKAILREPLGKARGSLMPDSECPEPQWQRAPVRVTFEPDGRAPVTFAVRGTSAEPAPSDEATTGAAESDAPPPADKP